MPTYTIEVTFFIEVEAEDAEEAENSGWGWTPRHPEHDEFMGETVSPSTVNVR